MTNCPPGLQQSEPKMTKTQLDLGIFEAKGAAKPDFTECSVH